MTKSIKGKKPMKSMLTDYLKGIRSDTDQIAGNSNNVVEN